MHPLDNPIWQALSSLQAPLAEVVGGARRFQAGLSPLAGIERPSAACYADLRELLGPDGGAGLFMPEAVEPGPGWRLVWTGRVDQMWCPRPALLPAGELVTLGAADLPEMLDLVSRTQPGPFEARTWELGRYLGVREGGRLVAMAGERLRLPAYTEVSAVCCDPAFRGGGLARRLVSELVRGMLARGETPFLHVMADNASARRAYAALGFVTRRQLTVSALRVTSA